jgi:DNA repair exonuclease SbcCD ATPase subunit
MVKTWFIVIAVVALGALSAAYFIARDRSSKLQEEISLLKKDLRQMQDKLANAKIENRNLVEEKKQLEDSLQAKVSELGKTVEQLSKDNNSLRARSAGLELEVKKLKSAAVEVPGESSVSEIFDEEKLLEEAKALLTEANFTYNDAVIRTVRKKKDELFDKAAKACDETIEKLIKISDYYEKHSIRHGNATIWAWEKMLEEVSKLKMYIVRDRGF